MKTNLSNSVVSVIGLGYVGLPLAIGFANHLKVIGYDINAPRIAHLKKEAFARNPNLTLTADPSFINQADYVIICVPTPVTEFKEPDLSPVINAARTVSRHLKGSIPPAASPVPPCHPGGHDEWPKDLGGGGKADSCSLIADSPVIVILESTVYPGVTEEVLVPILEESGLKCGPGFKVAYSPERINPGDVEHALSKVTKVVSGQDAPTLSAVAALYSLVSPSIFKAKNIKTAEAAKVIENTQRDLNIALMNELAMLFARMGIDTRDVLDAASTKWNFNRYSPGLVGGHCIPVDPYYLVYKARELNFHTQVILAGRAINDGMPKYIAELTVKALNSAGKVIKGSKVLIMGLTYKENVPDTRESPARGIIKELHDYEVDVYGYDPLLKKADLAKGFNIKPLASLKDAEKLIMDAVIITVAHDEFRKLKLEDLQKIQNSHPILVDIRRIFDGSKAKQLGFTYRTL